MSNPVILMNRSFIKTLKLVQLSRNFSDDKNQSCKLLVLGAGTGGCSIAAKFAGKLGKGNVIIVDPAQTHYYQPMLTMVGGGMKPIKDVGRPMSSVIPKNAKWIQDSVAHIDPKASQVTTANGTKINYDFLVVALGLELHYDKIKGALEALNMPGSGVCSNYSPLYAEKTIQTLRNFKGGNAVFTLPNTLIKCAGAPLKACLISEHYLRKEGLKDRSQVYYRTSLPSIFSVKHYAEKLIEICKERNIDVAYREELVEIKPDKQQAVFRNVDKPTQFNTIEYKMLHVVPPMGAARVIKESSSDLTDQAGFLTVDKGTLQHDKFKNIFGIGDNTNVPTSKTMAAIAGQAGILSKNLTSAMTGEKPKYNYDGYTSCPLVTGYGTCIMAEFDYNLEPLETFPINQRNENRAMFHMKKDIMPLLYWNAMLKGYWNGPKVVRKVLHLGMSK